MPLYLFCSGCYSWGAARTGRCSECGGVLDTKQHDPPPEQLQRVIGDLLRCIGPARVTRRGRAYPAGGVLYETTRGLFYLPHAQAEVMNYRERHVGPPWWLRVLSLFWFPLHLFEVLWQRTEVRGSLQVDYRMQILELSDSDALPELLMNNPEAFFLPRETILAVRRVNQRWVIDRTQGAPLQLTPEGDALAFHSQFRECLAGTQWRGLAMNVD